MSELAPVGTLTPLNNIRKLSCGILLANTEAKIVDTKTGENLGPGQIGELCIRGPQVSFKSHKF